MRERHRNHLRYLYTTLEFTADCPEKDRDSLQETYCYEWCDDIYMHVDAVKALPEDQKKSFGPMPSHVKPDEQEDFVRETWQENCPF